MARLETGEVTNLYIWVLGLWDELRSWYSGTEVSPEDSIEIDAMVVRQRGLFWYGQGSSQDPPTLTRNQ